MVMTNPTLKFIYLLNAMERASQSSAPAANGYGAKREAVLKYVEQAEQRLATIQLFWEEAKNQIKKTDKWHSLNAAITNAAIAQEEE